MAFWRKTRRVDAQCHSADILTPPERATDQAIKRELEMNYARYQQIENGLSSIARKVLTFVPIQDEYEPHVIAGVIKRETGAAIDRRVLDGVLSHLVDIGLIKQSRHGMYSRDAPPKVPDNTPTPVITKPEAKPMPTQKTPDSSFLAKIGALTARLRGISKESAKLADELDDVALEGSRQNEQLEALRKLLKGVID